MVVFVDVHDDVCMVGDSCYPVSVHWGLRVSEWRVEDLAVE